MIRMLNSRWILALLLMLFPFISGCGVESTSDPAPSRTITFRGTVSLASGQDSSGIRVMYVPSGDEIITDSNGDFALGPVPYEKFPEFLIETEQFSLLTSIDMTNEGNVVEVYLIFQIAPDLSSVVPVFIPKATPTPIPSDPQAPFDENGNTSSFGIPQGTSGNAHTGKRFYFSHCTTCHTAVRGRGFSYDRLKNTLSLPPMNTLKIRSQDIANLVAYLNFKK